MTKNQYINELRKELKLNHVSEIEDIIAEYEEHFNFKMEEGMSEEEIARKLSSPKEIAKDYLNVNIPVNKFEKVIKIAGLTFLSIPLTLAYIIMWSSVIVLGTFALVCLVASICLITKSNVSGLIPYIPYIPSLICGIACLGLSVLSIIGSICLYLYIKQWGKVYVRWCSNIANNNCYPSISKHPKISKKFSHRLKLTAMTGLVCFITGLVISYISMCIYAGSLEPWHIWHWFQ